MTMEWVMMMTANESIIINKNRFKLIQRGMKK